MKTILTITTLLLPILSLNAQQNTEEKKQPLPKTHPEIIVELCKPIEELGQILAKINTEDAAREFNAAAKLIPDQHRALVKKATSIPAPTPKELKAIQKTNDEFETAMQKHITSYRDNMTESELDYATVKLISSLVSQSMSTLYTKIGPGIDTIDQLYHLQETPENKEPEAQKPDQ